MFRHARTTIFLSHMDLNHGPTLVCGPLILKLLQSNLPSTKFTEPYCVCSIFHFSKIKSIVSLSDMCDAQIHQSLKEKQSGMLDMLGSWVYYS